MYSSLQPIDTSTPDPNDPALDSGASKHFARKITKCCIDIKPVHLRTNPSLSVHTATGETMHSSHTGTINLPKLPATARNAHLFPSMDTHDLLSVGVIADSGCTITFDAKHCLIASDNGEHLYQGYRDNNGLYRLPLPTMPTPVANLVLPTSTTSEIMQFLHASLFSPSVSTLLKAINNNHFTTWPALTSDNVKRHLPKSIATALGHLDQQRKNIQSTKVAHQPTSSTTLDDDDFTPTPAITDGTRTDYIYAAIEKVSSVPTGAIHTDQTGRFPVQSHTGKKYIMVLYDYDSNAILAEPISDRTAKEILRAYKKLHGLLVTRGLRPRLQRLDNEASTILTNFMAQENVDFQLAPPGIHRRNAAERAIRTFKNHFTAGLCTTDPNFPLYLWDELIDQATISLNLLRQSRINPRLSAHAQLHGNYDFNRTPMAPPGIRVVAHNKSDKRPSWGTHGDLGWYVGPAMNHYRCYRVYIPKTQASRINDTVEFFPTAIKMPALSSADAAQHAARDLIHAIENPHPATPFLYGEETMRGIQQLAKIFGLATDPSMTPAAPRVTPHVVEDSPHTTPHAPRVTPNLIEAAHKAAIIPSQAIPDAPLSDLFLAPPPTHPVDYYFANSVIDPITGKSMEYRELITNPATKTVWSKSAANEFGRLAQGVGGRVAGTDTIKFIARQDVPKDRTVTYARFVCTLRPQKSEPERTRLTVGGNLIDYPGDTSAPTADITTAKLHFNSVLSTPNAKCVCADVKNFYLNTPLDRPEFMRIAIDLVPQEIIEEYKLLPLVHNGFIYVRIEKGMYGLPQSGKLANDLLQRRLAKYGYYTARHTPGLWLHSYRPISFVLVVDDFAIKYVGKEHADHLLSILKKYYEGVSTDWDAALFCGISLKWDYDKRTVELSMPGYIAATLAKYNHPMPSRPQHSPHRFNAPQFGVKVQLTDPIDTAPKLSPKGRLRIQKIVGTLLYYGRAVDNTTLVALSELASDQSRATETTNTDIHRLLDYCATHPDAILKYYASDMILAIHSDAGYLNAGQGRSRVGGHFYLDNQPPKQPINNGAILNPTGILRHVASSAAEAETGGLFVNMKEGTILRTTLHEMGHPQTATPVTTDNSTAAGIANDTIKQQRSRAIDMRYHWIRDRITQQQFIVKWAPGTTNLADYFTKHHSAAHHQKMRPQYLANDPNSGHPSAYLCTPPASSTTANAHCEGVLIPHATSGMSASFPASTGQSQRSVVSRACQTQTGFPATFKTLAIYS